ncbi:MAG TPA: beta-N-acetylhexosaminidase [archaeon]|nr:beta-N-acetylhexosaminidase [archaeon]
MKNLAAIILFLGLACQVKTIQAETNPMAIIPLPMKIEKRDGSFVITPETTILVTRDTRRTGEYLARLLEPGTGLNLQVQEYSQPDRETGCIVLRTTPDLEQLGPEGYELKVLNDRVLLNAPTLAGIFYACQTLRQLLPPAIEKKEIQKAARVIPQVEIADRPRFKWRGLMLDCSRTFQTVDYLKRYIDLLAYYKLNVFHLHLTDDQGWRVEIKRYPKLVTVGSEFAGRYHTPGGYYTQEEIKQLVGYASSRNVTLVPEIEMPGHCLAALASYPELSCTGGPFEIYPFFKGPNIQENVFCAGKEATFEFLENVLNEIAGLFPCEYVHIGGDEVPKTIWKKCEKCQARIREQGLRDEEELQSYFVRRIESSLKTKNRRLIGWDEILEGGLAPEATVMSWRGMKGGVAAASEGHDVIMSPTSHCYLDYDYETTSVEKAYSFDPIPPELPTEKRKHILGLQGNMWTHIATNEDATDRQVFPRIIALAEVGWSAAELRDWAGFYKRLVLHYPRLEAMGVKYFVAEP